MKTSSVAVVINAVFVDVRVSRVIFVFPLTDIAGVSPIGAPGRSSSQGACTL